MIFAILLDAFPVRADHIELGVVARLRNTEHRGGERVSFVADASVLAVDLLARPMAPALLGLVEANVGQCLPQDRG